jgi:recX family
MKEGKSLKARALDLLARREYSRLELKRRLAPHAESEDEIDSLLAELSDRQWQSDERYAEAFIHSKSRSRGRLRLQQELAAKGVDESLVRANLPDRDTELANALAVLHKKFAAPPQNFQEKQKQIRFMLYRGFEMDIVQAAFKEEWPQ